MSRWNLKTLVYRHVPVYRATVRTATFRYSTFIKRSYLLGCEALPDVSKILSASIFENKQSKKSVSLSLFDLKDELTTVLQNARNCLRVDTA
jgi:hypothetical protein